MNAKAQETLRELLKKLSAVRVTLSDEEQALLDWLVQGSRPEFNVDEVVAQRMNAPLPKAEGPDEVKVQRMNAPLPRVEGPDEVTPQRMNAPAPAPQGVTIIYDPEQEAYWVIK